MLSERLAARTEPDTNGGCLLWSGCTHREGHGQIGVDGRVVYTHRVAWELANGPVPRGKYVLHRCDVPACVNPAHLFLGTHADNMADKVAKGRQHDGAGERNGRAKLTGADVQAIRARLAGGEGHGTIARDFGVTRAAVSDIKTGKRWGRFAS